jgi:hypothetical protein
VLEALKDLKQGSKQPAVESKKRGRASNNSAAAEPEDVQPPRAKRGKGQARKMLLGAVTGGDSSRGRSRGSQKRKAAEQEVEQEDEDEGDSEEEEEEEDEEDGSEEEEEEEEEDEDDDDEEEEDEDGEDDGESPAPLAADSCWRSNPARVSALLRGSQTMTKKMKRARTKTRMRTKRGPKRRRRRKRRTMAGARAPEGAARRSARAQLLYHATHLVARPCPSNTAQWPCHQLRPTPTASLVGLFWIAVERLPVEPRFRRSAARGKVNPISSGRGALSPRPPGP